MNRTGAILLAAATLLTPGCFLKHHRVDEGFVRLQQQAAFVPEKGMTRTEVEAYLGAPKHQSRTKDDLEYCMYTIEGSDALNLRDTEDGFLYGKDFEVYRSVIYDRQDKVLDFYGFERPLDVVPQPPVVAEKKEAADAKE